jgi:transcriptional regulator with XRE-family HTH domain
VKKNFGRTIKDLRKERGFSVNKFAKMVDVSHTSIQLLEKGETAAPKEKTIKRMAAILDQDPDKLLALAGKVDSELLKRILDAPEIVRTLKKFTIKEIKDRLTDEGSLLTTDVKSDNKNFKQEAKE